MLSKKLHDALNEQINAELWSAYLYLSMSMDAEAKGLDEQVEEEESVRDMITACEAVEGNKFGLYTLDKELAARVYQQASPLAANNA